MAFTVGIPIVDKFDLMDVANPYEIFCWLSPFWKDPDPHEVDVKLVGHESHVPVKAFNGASLITHASFKELASTPLDVLFVPGGGSDYVDAVLADKELLGFVRDHAENAKWVGSVCTGAFILAGAGLLNGRRATTHWMFLDRLRADFQSVAVVNGYPRFVNDGKFLTGGGISSGIDTALFLAGKIAGEQTGRDIELAIQYHPQPPYGVGDPAVSDYRTWKEVTTDLS